MQPPAQKLGQLQPTRFLPLRKNRFRRSELRLYLGDLWERLGEERGNQFFYYLRKVPRSPGGGKRQVEPVQKEKNICKHCKPPILGFKMLVFGGCIWGWKN